MSNAADIPTAESRLKLCGRSVWLWPLLGALLAGCAALEPRDALLGPGYTPENIHCATATLPNQIQRVAVLPLMTDETSSVMQAGRDALAPVLILELLKTKKFEVVRPTPEECRVITGRIGWTDEEVLPEELFKNLHKAFGCDAVLFCQLTTFRAYEPLAVGWRLKLVDIQNGQILWAADETFDAGRRPVQAGARWYQLGQQRSAGDGWVMENSPRLFGQYTLAKLLDTFPAR